MARGLPLSVRQRFIKVPLSQRRSRSEIRKRYAPTVVIESDWHRAAPQIDVCIPGFVAMQNVAAGPPVPLRAENMPADSRRVQFFWSVCSLSPLGERTRVRGFAILGFVFFRLQPATTPLIRPVGHFLPRGQEGPRNPVYFVDLPIVTAASVRRSAEGSNA